jgi:hypothetical protein
MHGRIGKIISFMGPIRQQYIHPYYWHYLIEVFGMIPFSFLFQGLVAFLLLFPIVDFPPEFLLLWVVVVVAQL